MKQVLQAVAYCHSKNIVHRDIKPENLMMDSPDTEVVKVIDFGTSTEYDKKKAMKQTFGTYFYIAPEVLNHNYNEKCDVWSVGAIMYTMLVGAPPFSGETEDDIIQSVLSGKFNKNSKHYRRLSQDAKGLIKSLLTM